MQTISMFGKKGDFLQGKNPLIHSKSFGAVFWQFVFGIINSVKKDILIQNRASIAKTFSFGYRQSFQQDQSTVSNLKI